MLQQKLLRPRLVKQFFAITIRLYANKEYNVRIYLQRYKDCNILIKPRLNDSNAEWFIALRNGMECRWRVRHGEGRARVHMRASHVRGVRLDIVVRCEEPSAWQCLGAYNVARKELWLCTQSEDLEIRRTWTELGVTSITLG
jgi:hypothetical protein